MKKDSKMSRVLTIYERLNKGEVINKQEISDELSVNVKTIQRDIDDIRAFYSESISQHGFVELKYTPKKKGYCLVNMGDNYLKNEEILAISKILLESRAFCKDELNSLLNALLMQVSPDQRKAIKEIIANELLHFIPLQHNKRLLNVIWDLSSYIRQRQMIRIKYKKQSGDEVERIVKPLSVIFSEYYFYLIANIDQSEHDSPAVFRVDKIITFSRIGDKFTIPEKLRFEPGEFRKRVQFMYPGKLLHIKFEFWGEPIDAILERLPTSRIISNEGKKFIIEAEVFGKGIIMWLLSQGSRLKVLEPQDLKDELASEIAQMLSLYSEVVM